MLVGDIDIMASSTGTNAVDFSLDALAMHAFVQEILGLVDNVALACISESEKGVIWSQVFHNGGRAPDECLPESSSWQDELTTTDLGQGDTAFHFPLQCANVANHIFTFVINSRRPPDIASIRFSIDSILTCMARQIDLDCALTTTRLVVEPREPFGTFTRCLEHLTSSANLKESLHELAIACKDDTAIEGIVIAIPDDQIIVIVEGENFSQQSAKKLLARLHDLVNKKRKMLSARVTLEDGSEGQVICAPIARSKDSVQGLVFAVSSVAGPTHSNVVRAIANRISKVPSNRPAQSKFLTRFELMTKVDEILGNQTQLPHSLIYFDNDKMHTINDAFGYSGGDRALLTFRGILSASAGSNDILAHLGSDRFAMFLPGASGDTALSKSTQIQRLLSQESIEAGGKSINLSVSAGVVDNQAAPKGCEDMLILAEVASRGAQDRGGNQSALFQDIDSSIIQRRSDVDKVGFLQMALIEDQFVLHAQRIQPIGTESGQKFELLARLYNKDAPDRSPAEYLSAAERYQLMAALDRWVVNSALSSIAAADNHLEVSLATFSINVSAQSLQDSSFVEFVESRIAEIGIPADTLCFELTETSLVRNIDRAQRFVHRMQRLGCQIALDDFGTGYSSFAYLKTLPVNYLKVDGAFVRDILESELSKAIVSSVVNIADVIGAQTVAEHVEKPMVQAWLKKAGVHYVQGFSVHKPEPFADVLASMDSMIIELDGSDGVDLRSVTSRGAHGVQFDGKSG